MAPASPSQPPAPFQEAFEQLLSLAPGPIFPKARRLYLNKYPLEGRPDRAPSPASSSSSSSASASAPRFRTFLLEEEIQEGSGGVVRVRAVRFALVHWQAPQTEPADYRTYLQERWQLSPLDLTLVEETWFRDGGAYAHFQAAAIYERATVAMPLLGLDQAPSS